MSGSTFLETNGSLVRTPSSVRDKVPNDFKTIEPKVFKMLSAHRAIAEAQYI